MIEQQFDASGDSYNNKAQNELILSQEGQAGMAERSSDYKSHVRDLKNGASSGITSEFGKPMIIGDDGSSVPKAEIKNPGSKYADGSSGLTGEINKPRSNKVEGWLTGEFNKPGAKNADGSSGLTGEINKPRSNKVEGWLTGEFNKPGAKNADGSNKVEGWLTGEFKKPEMSNPDGSRTQKAPGIHWKAYGREQIQSAKAQALVSGAIHTAEASELEPRIAV